MESGKSAKWVRPVARVLIVEDEPLLAMMLEDMVLQLGHSVAEILDNLASATAAVENSHFDIAVLDVNLRGQKSFPVAEALASRNIPFLFATGYGRAGLDNRF